MSALTIRPTFERWFRARISNRAARSLCYLMGPLSGTFFLHLRSFSEVWAVRFHAFDSMLVTALWAMLWGVLKLIEKMAPTWFLQSIVQVVRLDVDLAFMILWALLMLAAYQDRRLAVPYVHPIAVKLARRYQAQPWNG